MNRFMCAAVLALAFVASGCKPAQEVWFGVEPIDDGARLKLAAEESLCGCVTLANKSSRAIDLRASLHDVTAGAAKLNAGESLRVRFDWAGTTLHDVYVIEASEVTGRDVPFEEVVEVRERTPWEDCQQAECPWGSLLMNAAEVGR